MIFLELQVLKDTLTALHEEGEDNPYYQKVHTYVLNPKVTISHCHAQNS